MPYFKDLQNKVHHLDDATFSHLLPGDCVPITDAEAADLMKPTPEQEAAAAAAAAQAAADAEAKAAAKADATVQFFIDHTPAECAAKVIADVIDLATARQMLSRMAMALCVLAKRELR